MKKFLVLSFSGQVGADEYRYGFVEANDEEEAYKKADEEGIGYPGSFVSNCLIELNQDNITSLNQMAREAQPNPQGVKGMRIAITGEHNYSGNVEVWAFTNSEEEARKIENVLKTYNSKDAKGKQKLLQHLGNLGCYPFASQDEIVDYEETTLDSFKIVVIQDIESHPIKQQTEDITEQNIIDYFKAQNWQEQDELLRKINDEALWNKIFEPSEGTE